MAKQINPIETAVNEYLKAQGITFAAAGGYAMKREGWDCDAWMCTFSRQGKADMMLDYYTGVGHRELTRMGELELRRAGKSSQRCFDSIKAQHSKPVAPQAASVLCSVLSESQSAEQNFLDWCDDFGYDDDSIKALHIYNACCEQLQKVRAFFTNEEREAMQELLQDY
jgi:hypothetical protein